MVQITPGIEPLAALTELSLRALAPCLAKVLAPHPVTLAYLFGSAASGKMTPFSDVDIALVVEQGRVAAADRLKFELALEAQIADCCGLERADVRVINHAPLVLRGQVVTEGVLLFARNADARIEFEVRTRAEYFDFLPAAESLRAAFFADLRERGLNGQRSKN